MTQKPYYETMYILRPDIPEEEVESHLTKYSEVLTKAGAKILDNQMRGKRRLAYPISKHKEGIYVQLSHEGDGQHIGILEKAMRLSEDVIRYLTVKQDGPLPTPRAVPSTEKTETKEAGEKNSNKEAKDTTTKEKKEAKDTTTKEKQEAKDTTTKEKQEAKDTTTNEKQEAKDSTTKEKQEAKDITTNENK